MSFTDAPLLDANVAIETPEHIVFHYRVAGPARRALAYFLDLLLCYGTVAILVVIVSLVAVGSILTGPHVDTMAKGGAGFILLALFAAQWVYFVVLEAKLGRSPGKMALGLQVVTLSGRPIGWRAATLRNLLRAADLLPTAYVVGCVSMALSSKFQRIGDIVAGTMVIAAERVQAARPLVLSPPADPRELESLPSHVTLDAEERLAIDLFLRRRHTLGPTRTYQLAAMIAAPIGARLGYTHRDPARLLAIVYDRAVNSGRLEAAPTSWHPRRLARQRGSR